MKNITFLLSVFMLCSLFANADINRDYNAINGDCYDIKTFLLEEPVKYKLSKEEAREYNFNKRLNKPMTGADAVVVKGQNMQFLIWGTAEFKDLNAFANADYISKEKREAYLLNILTKYAYNGYGKQYCKAVAGSALRNRFNSVLKKCNDEFRFPNPNNFTGKNDWQTWALQFACSVNPFANKLMLVSFPDIIEDKGYLAHIVFDYTPFEKWVTNVDYSEHSSLCEYVMKKCDDNQKCVENRKGLYGQDDQYKSIVHGCGMSFYGKVYGKDRVYINKNISSSNFNLEEIQDFDTPL